MQESNMKTLNRITINPEICLGQPTIRNMRITVSFVLKLLADIQSIDAVIEAYPELELEDIQQSLQYAAWAVSEEIRRIPTA